MKISVLGCGRWGTFIAWYLDMIGHEVSLFGRSGSKNLQELKLNHKNSYLTIRDSITLIGLQYGIYQCLWTLRP